MTLDDVEGLLSRVGEERESLFFERKAHVSAASLVKSCAAFANTAGGLLLVGVPDDSDELGGTTQTGGEAQVWGEVGDTISLGRRSLRVIGVRDQGDDEPTVFVLENISE